MRGLDTNVLVRFLVRDDEAQFQRAARLIDELSAADEEARLDLIVLCELVWVLRTGYGRSRAEIGSALEALLDAAPFAIEERDLVRQAVERFRSGKGDFADYVIGLRNQRAGCTDTLTFDRKLRPAGGFVTP